MCTGRPARASEPRVRGAVAASDIATVPYHAALSRCQRTIARTGIVESGRRGDRPHETPSEAHHGDGCTASAARRSTRARRERAVTTGDRSATSTAGARFGPPFCGLSRGPANEPGGSRAPPSRGTVTAPRPSGRLPWTRHRDVARGSLWDLHTPRL